MEEESKSDLFPIDMDLNNVNECKTVSTEVISEKHMRKCDRCNFLMPFIEYYKHRISCKGTLSKSFFSCAHCNRKFQQLSLYYLHRTTCLKSQAKKLRNRPTYHLKKHKVLEEPCVTAMLEEKESIPKDCDVTVKETPVSVSKPSRYTKHCSLCDQRFRSLSHYKVHLKRKGLCRPRPYICYTCNREFMSAYHLLSHENQKTPCGLKLARSPNKGSLKMKIVKKNILNNHFSKKWPDDEGFEAASYKGNDNVQPIECQNFYSSNIPKEFDIYSFDDESSSTLKKSNCSSEFSDVSLNSRYLCETCNEIFMSSVHLLNHFEQNPTCSQTKSYKILDSKKSVKSNTLKQTARKSIPTSQLGTTKRINNEYNHSIRNEENKTGVISVFKSTSEKTIIGSARKSSQDNSGAMKKGSSDNRNLSCSTCREEFFNADALHKHKKMHSPDKKSEYSSKCPVCFQVFANTFLLFNHQKKYHHWGKAAKSKAGGCKCPFCGKMFLHVRSRNAHLRAHVDTHSKSIEIFLKNTTCEICSQAFVSESLKIQHLKIEHPNWTNVMPKLHTNIDLRNQDHYKRNYESKFENNSKDISSSHKLVGFSKKVKVMVNVTPSLKAKLKAHPNVCPICFKHYSTTFVRNRHFRMHILDTSFECRWCSTKFSRSDRLNLHMQQEHNDLLGFECLGCGLRYLSRVRALQHVVKVHGVQPAKSLVKEREIPVDQMEKEIKKSASLGKDCGGITKGGENNKLKGSESKGQDVGDFYCDVCETSFLKLCGLQRHRQSKNHRDCLASKDQTGISTSTAVVPQEEIPILNPPPPPCSEEPNKSPNDGELQCSFCLQSFNGIIDFVPHRLSHFHQQSLSEISEVNPYHCEICEVLVDHHQKVQWHLLHHLQMVKLKSVNSPPVKFIFGCRSTENLKSQNHDTKIEKSFGNQVAKKTLSSRSDRPIEKELLICGIKKTLFTCDACNVGFTTKYHYSSHVLRYCQVRKVANGTGSHMGLEDEPNDLQDQSLLHLPDSKLVCHHCSLEFDTVNDLGWHEKSCQKVNTAASDCYNNNNKEIIFCNKCQCMFASRNSYEEHINLFCIHGKNLATTTDTNRGKNLEMLKSAMKLERETVVTGCVQCSIIFPSLNKLKDHIGLHRQEMNSDTVECEEPQDMVDAGNVVESISDFGGPSIPKNDSVSIENLAMSSSESNTNVASESCMFQGSSEQILVNRNDTEEMNSINKLKNAECSDLQKHEENIKGSIVGEIFESDTLFEKALTDLRENFSELLFVLISDAELMEQLGWGQRLIDFVLVDILEHMGLTSVTDDCVDSELERLRQNIQILLESCIADQVMTHVMCGKPSVDHMVSEVLEICNGKKNGLSDLENLIPAVSAL